MDPLAIISAVETCYKYGTKVVEICRTWKDAHIEVEQRVVIIEAAWDRTNQQASFMARVAPVMDDHRRRINNNLLQQLSVCLAQAINTLETVVQRDILSRPNLFGFGFRAKKAAWVRKKDTVDGIITDLEAWQGRADPSWFLIMRIADPIIGNELARGRVVETKTHGLPTAAKQPFAVAAGLRNVLSPKPEQTKSVFLTDTPMKWRSIPFSSVKAGWLEGAGNARWYIVDTVEIGAAAQVRDVARDVGALAVKLSKADPLAFGLLNCKGAVAVPRQRRESHHPISPHPYQHDYECFKFILRIPEGMEVLQSLRHLLLNSDAHISLSRKNVRPESVLCFEKPAENPSLPSLHSSSAASISYHNSHAFLVGFDAFRASTADTLMSGDMRWERNVYRHPLRQGDDPAEKYRMQHDIYSLGVCLLELGLWESFVEYTEGGGAQTPQPKLGGTYENFQAWMREKPLAVTTATTSTGRADDTATRSRSDLAFWLKDYLVEQAQTRLAPRMGERYARVVLSCLACLDEDSEDFSGAAAEDTSDDAAALCFIENVIHALDEIAV